MLPPIGLSRPLLSRNPTIETVAASATGLRTVLLWLGPVVLYTLLASHALHLPGIYFDEVIQAVPALAALSGEVRGPVLQVDGSVITIGERRFPLLILPYLGSTQAAVLTASFAAFGASVITLRLTYIALGGLALLCAIGCARQLFDTRVAWTAGLLLAVDPIFIFATRSDSGPTAIMLICKLGALWLLLRWWQGGRTLDLASAALLCGLGLYDKLNFVWFLAALASSVAVIAPGPALSRLRALSWRARAAITAAFCAGAVVPMAYVLGTGGGAFRGLLQLARQPTALGIDNRDVLGNLTARFGTLFDLLGGYELLDVYTSAFSGYQYEYDRWPFVSTLVPTLTVAAAIAGLLVALRLRRGLSPRKTAFLLLLTGLIVLLSAFTPTTLSYHHLLLAYPFPHLAAAALLAALPTLAAAGGRQWSALFRVGVVMVAIIPSLGVTATYYQVLDRSGGVGMWSDAVYSLADYLRGDERVVVCMDWGISQNLLMLSSGRLQTTDEWQRFVNLQADTPEMRELVAGPGRVFVFHAPRYAGVLAIADYDGPRMSFHRTVAAMGATAKLERTFAQRDGDPVFELYTVEWTNAAI